MNRFIIAGAVAAVCSTSALAAQQPQAQTKAQGTAVDKRTQATVVGCVYREKDIPGRSPNLAEKAGILEDYILVELASATVAKDSTATKGATGTSGQFGRMYKLEYASDDKLQTLVGRRVEVIGQIDSEEGDSKAPPTPVVTSPTDKAVGRDRVNLSEFEVASIKEVSGTCPASPTPR